MITGVDNKEAIFNVYRDIQLPCCYEDLALISVVDAYEPVLGPSVSDAFEKALLLFNRIELEEEIKEMMNILDASCEYIRDEP